MDVKPGWLFTGVTLLTMTVIQEPETESAMWNSAIIHLIICFPAVKCQIVFCEKGTLVYTEL